MQPTLMQILDIFLFTTLPLGTWLFLPKPFLSLHTILHLGIFWMYLINYQVTKPVSIPASQTSQQTFDQRTTQQVPPTSQQDTQRTTQQVPPTSQQESQTSQQGTQQGTQTSPQTSAQDSSSSALFYSTGFIVLTTLSATM